MSTQEQRDTIFELREAAQHTSKPELLDKARITMLELLADVDRLTQAEQAASEANYTFSADLLRMTAERDAAYRLLESLTPGGSEFYDSPKNCAEWAQRRMSSVMEQVKARKQAESERDALAAELATVRAQVARFEEIERYYQDRNNVIADTGSRRNSWQQP